MSYDTITFRDDDGRVYSFRVDDVNFLSIDRGSGFSSGIHCYRFNIYFKKQEPFHFHIYRWRRDSKNDIRASLEMENENTLETSHIKCILYVLEELKCHDFLDESEYKVYLDRIEEIICKYYDYKTDELEKELDEFSENLNEVESDRSSSEILREINSLVDEVEQNNLEDASL